MQSYCSDVTKYLLAASEGVSILSVKRGVIDISNFAKQIGGQGIVRYQWGNPSSHWSGDLEHHFAADHDTSRRIVEATRSLNINVLELAFKQEIQQMAAQISKVAEISLNAAQDYFMCGIQGDGEHGEVETVMLLFLRTKLADKSEGDRKVMAKTVVFMRALRSMTMFVGQEDLVVKERETIRDTVYRLWPIVEDAKKLPEVIRTASKTERMILHDMRACPEGEDVADYVVSTARTRILSHLRGAGGFVVNSLGRKFEISSRGDGSCGMFYREFIIDESTTESAEHTVGTSVSLTAGIFEFGIEASVSYSYSQGWSMSTSENPTEWKRVQEKSFLDGLGEGPTSMGKLLLMMNWHVGGLDEWYAVPGPGKSGYGCVMKEEPISLENTQYVQAIKIDSYFRLGDMLAASGTGNGKWDKFLVDKGGKMKVLDFDRAGNNDTSLMTRFESACAAGINGLDESQKEAYVGDPEPVDELPYFLSPGFEYHARNPRKPINGEATAVKVLGTKPIKLVDAKQSSTAWGGIASRAIDGNTSGNWTSYSLTHTEFEDKPWWRAKFELLQGVTYTVGKVVAYNRTDPGCTDRLDGGVIRLLLGGKVVASEVIPGKDWAVYESGPSSALAGVVADTVEVTLPTKNYLSLAAVVVYGDY